MTIILDQYAVPETKGPFEIRQAITLNVTAAEAQKIAARWLRDEVAFMLIAAEPTLVVREERAVWRVPAVLTATHIGQVGEIGTVDVDVESEELYRDQALQETLLEKAIALADTLPPFKLHELEGDAAKWLARDVEPTPRVESNLTLDEIIATAEKSAAS